MSNDEIETVLTDRGLLKICIDLIAPEDPRDDFDYFCDWLTYDYSTLRDSGETGLDPRDYSNWEELEKELLKQHPNAITAPLYKYDHGNVSYNTTGFSCGWDSGCVGIVYYTLEHVRESHDVKRVTQEIREIYEKNLISDVNYFSNWACGNIYGFILNEDCGEDGVDEEACWGFVGDDWKHAGILGHVEANIVEKGTKLSFRKNPKAIECIAEVVSINYDDEFTFKPMSDKDVLPVMARDTLVQLFRDGNVSVVKEQANGKT